MKFVIAAVLYVLFLTSAFIGGVCFEKLFGSCQDSLTKCERKVQSASRAQLGCEAVLRQHAVDLNFAEYQLQKCLEVLQEK